MGTSTATTTRQASTEITVSRLEVSIVVVVSALTSQELCYVSDVSHFVYIYTQVVLEAVDRYEKFKICLRVFWFSSFCTNISSNSVIGNAL